MTNDPRYRTTTLLSVATLLFGAHFAGDAVAQSGAAPTPPTPARPPTKAAATPRRPGPTTQVATNKSAGQSNHFIGIANPHRQNLPAAPLTLPHVLSVNFWDSNDSAIDAPATRVLVAVNDKKIGVVNLPAFRSPPAVKKEGPWGITWSEWAGPPRNWSIVTPEVSCLRLEPRPKKYPGDSSTSPDNAAQYHSGCIVNIKIWMDVPETLPCTLVGPICIELLPTDKPAYAGDIEVLDDVSQFPPCAGTATPTCTTPGFGWKARPPG